jgi:hypothetical protein
MAFDPKEIILKQFIQVFLFRAAISTYISLLTYVLGPLRHSPYSLPASPALGFAKREAERYLRKIGALDAEKMICYPSRVTMKRAILAERLHKSSPEVRNDF